MPQKDISSEIDEMASNLEKATMDPKEMLLKTIMGLGKEGIKARLPLLSEEDKTILKAALEELSLTKAKSVEFDKEADGAKVHQGNIMDTVIQEEKGDDDADEELVKPEAAKHSHQGNSVEGWEGQVIKAKNELEKCPECTKLEKKQGVPKGADLATHERCVHDLKNQGKSKQSAYAICNASGAGMKKGQVPVEEAKETKKEEKKQIEEKKQAGQILDKSGEKFKKLKNELSHEKGVSNPAGLAAKSGREKLGKEAFDKKAAEGRKKHMKKSTEELIEEMKKSEDLLIKAIDQMRKKGLRKKAIKEKLEKYGMGKDMVEKAMEKRKAKKAMSEQEAEKEIMAMERKEHGDKAPAQMVEAERAEHMKKKMKKSESEHDSGTLLEEEKQLGDTEQMTEECKDLGDETQDAAKANKKAQDDVNRMEVPGLKKSVPWADEQALLKSYTGGRNFTFNVGDFVETLLKSEEDMKARGKMEERREKNEKEEELLKEKKSKEEAKMHMKKSEDLNDLIEKGLDTSWFQEDMKKSLEETKKSQTGKLVKSFSDNEIAAALGLTEEEAKKILG
jgi:hypothetical protein